MSVNLYERRWLKTQDHIKGRGLEIGAGASPQKLPPGSEALYFDKRTRAELSEYFGASVGASIRCEVRPVDDIPLIFPDGADFLIAHHVLEHTPDPIGTLREWHRFVRSGGTLAVSVPYYALCPDRDRLRPDFEHLLLDHFLNRGGDSFESREHVLSFLCSWVDDSPGLANLNKSECCRRIVSETKRGGHDFHWHAFDHELFRDIVFAAALLDDWAPDFYESIIGDEQVLDILCVYHLVPFAERKESQEAARAADKIRGILGKMQAALTRFGALSWNKKS